MNNPQVIFRRAWFTAGQGELWNCQGTYCEVPYENLPRMERAADDLAWLDQVSPELRRIVGDRSTLNSGDNEIANLGAIVARCQNLKLDLPEPFLRFMRDARLQAKVPTCTDCHIELSDEPIPVPGADGQFLLRFLNDSQSCVMWYLYLRPGEQAGVVASGCFLEPDIFEAMEYEEITREEAFKEAFICADTFSEFLYRFWVENTIWFSLHKWLDLSPVQEEYRARITTKL